ncbi:hypothetical protein ACHHRT_00435 [Desulfurivibrio sp. D14AmB]|uniref:hypothetical protein n=1 Tax=Desulfurivibrio sp. D14AmB TaxID=3374370 RepID=UPI00376EA3EE
MNRLLAQIVLVLMAIGLLYSMYAFSQGRFIEAMVIYPLLIAGYLFSRTIGKNRGDD